MSLEEKPAGWPAPARSQPWVEKKVAKSTVGRAIVELMPPTQSTWATFLPARSAAAASVSACRTTEDEKEVRLLKASPVRWKVLLVEPCSPGHVPVMSV